MYTNFQKPNYLAPYKGLQGALAHTAATSLAEDIHGVLNKSALGILTSQ